ncbi:hypothetical protein DM784_04740 [Vibrio furnissii]|nr:hypothetical protein DM784_04740 [Vibrio furnissii]
MVGFFVIRHMRRGRTSCPSWSRRSKQEKLDQTGVVFLLSGGWEEGEPRAQAGRVAPNKESLIRNGRAFCYLADAKRANLVPKLVASLQTKKARSEMVGLWLSGGCEEGEPRAQAGRVVPNKESPIRNGRVFCYPAHAKRANLVPKLVASFQTRQA